MTVVGKAILGSSGVRIGLNGRHSGVRIGLNGRRSGVRIGLNGQQERAKTRKASPRQKKTPKRTFSKAQMKYVQLEVGWVLPNRPRPTFSEGGYSLWQRRAVNR